MIAGYKTYVALLGNLAENKEIISSGMRQEIKRAGLAIKHAQAGKAVAVISSGDAGSYGMAGLILELLSEKQLAQIKVEIIPGVPALASCASLLGAPLMHDFAAISLSDLLTDKRLIMQRVEAAAKADFAIVLYNPKAKKRRAPLDEAWKILMKYKSPQTPVGIVRNAYRQGQEVVITRLENLPGMEMIDMVTTIIIGNQKTYVKGKYLITPRGYEKNYSYTPRRDKL